jgi:hypothetical protein
MMEMMILTRSRRIHIALRVVRARIPAKDWRTISSFLCWIRAQSEWKTLGLQSEVDKSGGGLFPLFELDVDIREQKNPRGQVIFTLPICRLYSDKALIGLVAHELAHAVRAAKLGPGWYERMDCRYRAEERIADAMASRWGFRSHSRAHRHEQKTFVLPTLDSQEARILRLIMRRRHILREKLRPKFDAARQRATMRQSM